MKKLYFVLFVVILVTFIGCDIYFVDDSFTVEIKDPSHISQIYGDITKPGTYIFNHPVSFKIRAEVYYTNQWSCGYHTTTKYFTDVDSDLKITIVKHGTSYPRIVVE